MNYTKRNKPRLNWEAVDHRDTWVKNDLVTICTLARVAIAGGRLVRDNHHNLIYMPDGAHSWQITEQKEKEKRQ